MDAPTDAYGETPAERARRIALNHAMGMPDDFVMSPSVLEQHPAPRLPPGDVLPVPDPPTRFLAGRRDPAGRAARIIARRIPTLPNYRAIIPGGVWSDEATVWSIRPEADCLAALDEAAIPYARPAETIRTAIPSPVMITGPIDGVTYTMIARERETEWYEEAVIVSCELALRMRTISAVAAAHDVTGIEILSAFRTAPRSSFHTMGLGLDLFAFHTEDGTVLSVYEDFVETPAHTTCAAPRPDGSAGTLLDIACELAASHDFSSVLTPNYNDGHRNHFHVDIRPDDGRTFVR